MIRLLALISVLLVSSCAARHEHLVCPQGYVLVRHHNTHRETCLLHPVYQKEKQRWERLDR